MKIESFFYIPDKGWSVNPFPALDSEDTLVLAFGAPEFMDTPDPILQLAKAYPRSCVVGCSTAGEILGTQLYDKSLVVSVVKFEHSHLILASAPSHSPQDSFNAGRSLASQLKKPDLRSVLVFSEGSHVNGSELVNGFNLPANVTITGGLAGDGDRFQRTWVIYAGRPQTEMVVAVGLCGDNLAIGYGSRSGWSASNVEWRVTKSQDNVLYELNGKPALQLYKEYLGEKASALPAVALRFPLALRADAADDHPVIRTILTVDEAAKSMVFAGDIPQGYLAEIMTANLDQLITSASEATAMSHVQNQADTLCIAVSCVGRRLVLGERTKEELEAAIKALPPHTAQIGFYSYGEISPSGGYCDLHNQTMTVTTIQETAIAN